MSQIPLDVFAPYLPPLKLSADEIEALKRDIFANIRAGYDYGKEKAAGNKTPSVRE